MPRAELDVDVTPEERLRKKVMEARRLSHLSPSQSLRMGFDLTAFGRKLAEAADRAAR